MGELIRDYREAFWVACGNCGEELTIANGAAICFECGSVHQPTSDLWVPIWLEDKRAKLQ